MDNGVRPTDFPSTMTSAPAGRDTTWSDAGPVSGGFSSTTAGGTPVVGRATPLRGAGTAGTPGSGAPDGVRATGGVAGVGLGAGLGTTSCGSTRTGSGTVASLNGFPGDADPDVGAAASAAGGAACEPWPA